MQSTPSREGMLLDVETPREDSTVSTSPWFIMKEYGAIGIPGVKQQHSAALRIFRQRYKETAPHPFFASQSKGMGTKREIAKQEMTGGTKQKMPLDGCNEIQSPFSYLCRLAGGGLTGCESSKSCATTSSTGLSKGLYSGG